MIYYHCNKSADFNRRKDLVMAKTKGKAKGKTKKEYWERDFSGGTLRVYPATRRKQNDFFVISLECGFAITGQVVEYDEGIFLSYPSYKNKDGEYKNLAYCFDKDVIAELQEILDEMYE